MGCGLVVLGMLCAGVAALIGFDQDKSSAGSLADYFLLSLYVLSFGLGGGALYLIQKHRSRWYECVFAWGAALAIVLLGCYVCALQAGSGRASEWYWGTGSTAALVALLVASLIRVRRDAKQRASGVNALPGFPPIIGDPTQITVKRRTGWSDLLQTYKVMLDGVVVGSVRARETFTVPVSPGKHSLVLTAGFCSSEQIPFEVRPGEHVFFECNNRSLKLGLQIACWQFFIFLLVQLAIVTALTSNLAWWIWAGALVLNLAGLVFIFFQWRGRIITTEQIMDESHPLPNEVEGACDRLVVATPSTERGSPAGSKNAYRYGLSAAYLLLVAGWGLLGFVCWKNTSLQMDLTIQTQFTAKLAAQANYDESGQNLDQRNTSSEYSLKKMKPLVPNREKQLFAHTYNAALAELVNPSAPNPKKLQYIMKKYGLTNTASRPTRQRNSAPH